MADDSNTAGSVVVQITGSTAAFEQAMAKAQAQAKAFDTQVSSSVSASVTSALNKVANVGSQATAALAKVTAPAAAAGQQIAAMANSSDRARDAFGRFVSAGNGVVATNETIKSSAADVASALARINSTTGVTDGYRATAADVAAYGKALDDVRAKFNPLFAVEREHNALLQEMVQAARAGAISADELFDAINRQGAAYQRQIAGVNASNAALKGTSFQTANIAAQFQDIAVQLQAGQNPFQIALQQGTQLSSALGPGKGLKGTLSELAAGFGSLLSPVSLLTIGVIALGGIGVQALVAMLPKVKSLDDLLTEHTTIIGEIKQAWSGAADGLDAYDRKSQSLLAAQARNNATLLAAQARDVNNALLSAISFGGYGTSKSGGAAFGVRPEFAAFKDQIVELRTEVKAGKPDFDAFYAAVEKKVSADPGLRAMADKLELATKDAESLARAIGQAGTAAAIAGQHFNQAQLSNFFGGTFSAVDASKSAQAFKLQKDAITALGPAQQGQIAYAQKLNELSDAGLSYDRMLQEAEQAKTLAVTQGQFALGQANQARLRAANDNIDAAKTDLSTIGLSIGETQRLTFVRQQLASAESEAAQNGVSVSAAYIAKIREIGAAYGELQQKIAESKAMSDAMFATSQFGRTSDEQGVASTLRGIYGDDFQSQMDGALANQLRFNQALQQGQQMAQSFGSTLVSDLMQGKSATDTLTDAFGNLAQQLMQMVLNKAIASLFSSIIGGGAGSIAGLGEAGGFGSSYAVGGFTGVGPRLKPAGVVHKGEYVFDAASTSRIGVQRLDKLRGYATGGIVGGRPGNDTGNVVYLQPIIQNNASDTTAASASIGDDGNLYVTIDKLNAKLAADPASRTNRANRSAFGLRNTTVRRS